VIKKKQKLRVILGFLKQKKVLQYKNRTNTIKQKTQLFEIQIITFLFSGEDGSTNIANLIILKTH